MFLNYNLAPFFYDVILAMVLAMSWDSVLKKLWCHMSRCDMYSTTSNSPLTCYFNLHNILYPRCYVLHVLHKWWQSYLPTVTGHIIR
uniref:Predicted protein n=1 Tax=Hordeum vulgare subsp. vulgare TaxID=112509 RepID=F2DWV1_HORVV|nr:predicted protein [Hordeum vulgare subsp. vulgare]